MNQWFTLSLSAQILVKVSSNLATYKHVHDKIKLRMNDKHKDMTYHLICINVWPGLI